MPKKTIYLDFAAASPMDLAVAEAMQPYFTDKFHNPSATYAEAVSIKKDIETARASVSFWLGARPSNIIFTAGGTEANNLALFGVTGKFTDCHVVTTAIEHESILNPLVQFQMQGGSFTSVLPQSNGIVDPGEIVKSVIDKTVLVSVMYANNEIGTIQPIKEIASEIAKIRKQRHKNGNNLPIFLHTDACQAAAYLDLHVARLGVDLMTVNGGKIYGPKQSGVLYIASNVTLRPTIFGGGQERGIRSGTENVPGIIGLAKALDLVQTRRELERDRLFELQKLFITEMLAKIPSAVINGSVKKRLPNNLHITIPGSDNERLVFALDNEGIQCAAGSACSASSDEPSHVLKALGMSDKTARSSLRFSMGHTTTEKDILRTVSTLAKIVAI